MKSAPSSPVLAALAQLDAARDNLRRAIEAESGGDDRPVPIKTLADRYGVSDKTMQRLAKAGAGVKIGGCWHAYPCLILLPEKLPPR